MIVRAASRGGGVSTPNENRSKQSPGLTFIDPR
jgi:hypothetical protein